ncbi:MAG: Spermidine synthase-like protein [Candidatus Gallionella acididurans]|uniref:Spermidine synthase-like protein n=1 Tax=Candidatus Gallionella acididurans TaxID=1796491 RepID=A0A139BUV6_9PROT|nr:MAG: Spermidine synthase-like protein [Candidatus Gallionella acididurans]
MSSIQPACLNSNSSSKISWWWVVAILYSLSGLTSLAYEVLWARLLSMQFGVSIFGVVLTVAAFMFGLGMGSLAGVRYAKLCKKPLGLFALLEIAIALYALLLPGLLHSLSGWMESIASHLTLTQWYLTQGVEALCLLVIPAFAMGLGFALVLKVVAHTPLSMGKLYGLNTIGGVVGALFPLWSLPVLGWLDSVRSVASIGLMVGIAALILSRFARAGDEKFTSSEKINQPRPPVLELVIYGGIGAGSIMLEIGWIRLYGMIMLRTEYVLGVILAVFLLGIAFGSLLLPRHPKNWLTVLMPVMAGGAVLLGMYLLPSASAWIESRQFQSFFGAMWLQALMLGVFTLPVTLVLGAWLPLMANRLGNAESSGVWLYGANCIGGGIGAIVACLVCIPWLGSEAMVVLAGLVIAALGLLWARPRLAWVAILPMLLLAWPLRNMPPVHELLPKIEANSRDLYLYEDAISLTQVVRQQDGQRVLLSDLQRMDASTEPSAVEIQMDQARLALLLHPAPHSVLFLGLGTGISMAGSLPFPDLQRTAVELSQGSIYAARNWFSLVNGNVMDTAQVQRDDARHFLSTTQHNYDVIVGDLFHPDLAGMGSLLSVQHFQRARNHLNADGVFVQWLALNQFDIQSLQVVLRSFQRVFPEAQMFMDGMHLALVGPERQMSAHIMLENLHHLSVKQQGLATGGEGAWTWLGRYWGPIPETSGPVQDEWMPYIEFNLPRARYDGRVNLANLMQWLLQRHPDANNAMKILGIGAENMNQFGRAYVATELIVRAWVASIQGDAEKAGNLIWVAYQANPQDHWIANALADNMLMSLSQAGEHGLSPRQALQRILDFNPNFVGALRAIWHLERSAGNTKESESYRLRLLAISPLDSEARATP